MAFTQEELQILKRANEAGLLSKEQQKQILQIQSQSTPQPEQKPTLSELTDGAVSAPTFQMAGATAAAALTTRAKPLTQLGAGGLGAAAGSITFDNIENFTSALGITRPTNEGGIDIALRAGQAAKEDVLFGGGFMAGFAALSSLGLPLIGRIIGARTDEVDTIMKNADGTGIHLGGVDVVDGVRGKILRGGSKVMGIFPFIGGPFRTGAVTKAQQAVQATNKMLNRMAPNAVLTDDLGIDMLKASRNSMEEFRNVSNELYGNFRHLVENASNPNIIPTSKIKGAAGLFVRKMEKGRVILQDGEELQGPVADMLADYMNGLTRLPDTINFNQFEKLADDLEDFIKKAVNDGYDIKRAVTLKKSLEASLSDLKYSRLKPGEGEAIREAHRAANRFYSNGIVVFQSPTGKRVGRAEKNIFKVGAVEPGTMDPDLLADAIINMKSATGLKDLRRLVGDDQMNRAARNVIERKWNNALIMDDEGIIKGIDWDKFKKSFIGKDGVSNKAADELLRSTGVSTKDIDNLVETARRIVVSKDVSTFIARRASLGGMKSAFKGASTANIIADSLLTSVGVAFLLRHASKILSHPAKLRAMRASLEPSTHQNARRAMLGRVIEAVEDEEEDE